MFTYDTIEETKKYIMKLFQEKIIPHYPKMDEKMNFSRIFICFQFCQSDIIHIIQKELNTSVPVKSLDDDTSYIELDFCDKLIHSKEQIPIYGGEKRNGNPTKTKCDGMIRLFREEYNIPFYYVSLHVSYGSPYFDFDHPDIGISEDTSPGFFYRRDLDFSPRSSWEANLARLLNYKQISFQYETEAISIIRKYKGTEIPGIYIPDFFLEDGSVIEVKGFWDEYSREKCAYFSKTYPQRPYFILDVDFYLSMSELYSDLIPNWEVDNSIRSIKNILQVVGLNFGSRKNTVKHLKIGQSVKLIRDSGNKFDKNAILCFTEDMQEIGFVSSDWACIYAPKIDMGMSFSATVTNIQPKKIDISVIRTNQEEMILWDFLK